MRRKTKKASSDLRGIAFVLEPVALALDLDDLGVVERAVEPGRGQFAVSGEGLVPGEKLRFEVMIAEPRS